MDLITVDSSRKIIIRHWWLSLLFLLIPFKKIVFKHKVNVQCDAGEGWRRSVGPIM